MQREFLLHLARIWHEPDEGLWEVRSGREHFTHSKVMAWLAFDRAIRSAVMFKLAGSNRGMVRPTRRASMPMSAREVSIPISVRSCVPMVRKELDASLLLLPAIGFLPAHDPRIVANHCGHRAPSVGRRPGAALRQRDRSRWSSAQARVSFLPAASGSPMPISCSAAATKHCACSTIFLSLRNDVGLLSEAIRTAHGPAGRNFPQAFSHLALVNTASNLAHYQKPAEQRAEHRVVEKPPMQPA